MIMAERNPKDEISPARQMLASGMTLGTQLAVGMVVFTLLGAWVDRKRGGGYGFTLGGVFLGLFYCGYEVWKLVRELERNDREKPHG